MKRPPLKVLIVDDEEHCRKALQRLINEYCPHIATTLLAPNVMEARKLMVDHTVDLLFLDVEMPGETGLEFLEQIRHEKLPVIFTTAHEHYALPALKLNALDYLLKPVEGKELVQAVNKLDDSSGKLLPPEQEAKVALPTTSGLRFLKTGEIIRCEADGAYTKVFTTKDTLLISRNIGQLEKQFSAHNFFRAHKSHLINLSHVREYLRGKGGTIILSNNSSVELSKRRREDFLIAVSR